MQLQESLLSEIGMNIIVPEKHFNITAQQERLIRKWLFQKYNLIDVDFSVIQAFIENEEWVIFEELDKEVAEELGFSYVETDRYESDTERKNGLLDRISCDYEY